MPPALRSPLKPYSLLASLPMLLQRSVNGSGTGGTETPYRLHHTHLHTLSPLRALAHALLQHTMLVIAVNAAPRGDPPALLRLFAAHPQIRRQTDAFSLPFRYTCPMSVMGNVPFPSPCVLSSPSLGGTTRRAGLPWSYQQDRSLASMPLPRSAGALPQADARALFLGRKPRGSLAPSSLKQGDDPLSQRADLHREAMLLFRLH